MTDELSVLHVVVGHGLPAYFMNAVRSVREVAPGDSLLILDNASPDPGLRENLVQFAADDPMVETVLRGNNDVEANGKVGSLYEAYHVAFDYASSRGFDLVHLMQADFQLMWWDDDVVARAMSIYDHHPDCVNISTQILTRDELLGDEVSPSATEGVLALKNYGLTDTGLYHLGRWLSSGLTFGPSERAHSQRALQSGFEVLMHPWPTDAPIPWPAVIREGRQRGREVRTSERFLLRPLSPVKIAEIKGSGNQSWLEDVAVPWGWICLTPYWTTGVNSIDYWVMRSRDARRNGLFSALPRLELRGVSGKDRSRSARFDYCLPLFRLLIREPAREVHRRFSAWLSRNLSKRARAQNAAL